MKLLNFFADKNQENAAISGGQSFFHRVLQMRRNFLTTCTQKSTQGKKLQADAALCGRSMVEMLGVLAIIGVLSVGAIAGYGTAMYKYRMNKTVQAVTDFMQNLVELSTKRWDDLGVTAQYVKYDLLPASMCSEDYVDVNGHKGYACKLPLGEIAMSFTNEPFLYGSFWISFYEGDIVKSCVDFLSHGWQNMYPQEWLRTDEDYWGSSIYINGTFEQSLWAVKPENAGGKKDNITLSDIQNACDACKGEEYCRIDIVINQEW